MKNLLLRLVEKASEDEEDALARRDLVVVPSLRVDRNESCADDEDDERADPDFP